MVEIKEPTPSVPLYRRVINFDNLEIKDLLLSFSVITYISGFLITNFFLGYLGIVHFDLLRVKYIISGFMYLLFLLSILFPIYGLIHTLKESHGNSKFFLIYRVCWFTFIAYGIILFLTVFVSRLAGTSILKIGFVGKSSVIPLSEYLVSSLPLVYNFALSTVFLTIILIPIIFLFIISIIIIFNPSSNGQKFNRKESLTRFLKLGGDGFWEFIKSILQFLLVIFIGTFILAYVVRVFTYFVSDDFLASFLFSSTNTTLISLNDGWLRLFIISFSIYLFLTVLVTIPYFLYDSSSKRKTSPDLYNFPENVLWNIFFVTIFVTFTLSVYTIAIYPLLPQQLGGGRPIPVSVEANLEKNESKSSEVNNILLIDRTSSTMIFLVINKQNMNNDIVEVSNSQITSITYLNTPVSYPP